jgi:hypothetical protein
MLNTVSNNYLSNCDLINKYNLKNIHHIPRLKKIVLDFNLFDFLNSSDFNLKEQTDSNSQIKSFIIL